MNAPVDLLPTYVYETEINIKHPVSYIDKDHSIY